MQDRIFGDREKALEEAYFRGQDAKLLEKLRQNAHLDEIAIELGQKLEIDNPDLIARVKDLGVTLETAPAFFFGPLIQVAWAEGKVPKGGHDEVIRQARDRGIQASSPAFSQLEEWLHNRPSDIFFQTAIDVLKCGFSVLTPAERDKRIDVILQACHDVAEASAGLGKFFGLADGVSTPEGAALDDISRALRSHI